MCDQSRRGAHPAIALEHQIHIFQRREGRLFFQVFIVVSGIRGHHDKAALGVYPDGLQSCSVSGDVVHADTRSDFFDSLMKHHPVSVDQSHHAGHVVQAERPAQLLEMQSAGAPVDDLGPADSGFDRPDSNNSSRLAAFRATRFNLLVIDPDQFFILVLKLSFSERVSSAQTVRFCIRRVGNTRPCRH